MTWIAPGDCMTQATENQKSNKEVMQDDRR